MRSVSILWGIVKSILCDGVAWRAPDFGLKSHVKARGLQGDDAASVARFQLTSAVFRRQCRPPVAIETSEHSHSITMGTAITSDRPPSPLGARHRSYPSDLAFDRGLRYLYQPFI
ncbi:hypothetical protein THAOC_15862 [Thalassiosira oceanica]|uniref:Uncharacterized protein n=1 Tax=Thalassiosira oceanica TaxID=159749 RepID=K0SDK2_THAOC|nr:hypothetical protein THAOC_15862 [Thalassiosira oceanica]|eukprot:EJK63475.1 hypothetical protein THAOC_15862 [Thalassiosira oceanica]